MDKLRILKCVWEESLGWFKSGWLNADNSSVGINRHSRMMTMVRLIMLLVVVLSVGCQHVQHHDRKPTRQITEVNINTEWEGDKPKVQANITMKWVR